MWGFHAAESEVEAGRNGQTPRFPTRGSPEGHSLGLVAGTHFPLSVSLLLFLSFLLWSLPPPSLSHSLPVFLQLINIRYTNVTKSPSRCGPVDGASAHGQKGPGVHSGQEPTPQLQAPAPALAGRVREATNPCLSLRSMCLSQIDVPLSPPPFHFL